MSYTTETENCVSVLEEVGSATYASAPRKGKSWLYENEERQFAEFTAPSLEAVRSYLAKYGAVLARVKYRQPNFFGTGETWSASLLEMFSCMLGDRDGSAEYVLANAARLREALTTHAEEFKAREFALEMQAMTRADRVTDCGRPVGSPYEGQD